MAKKSKQTSIHSPVLTKDLVIQAAIRLADAGGLEALSMRKLGRELGVEAMALYYHFSNKSQLIDGMIDCIHGDINVPQIEVNWKEFTRSRAESAFEVLVLHPWAAPIMEAGVNPGPSTLRDSDNCMKCFRKAGFSIPMTVHAVTVLNIYIYGAAESYARLNFSSSQEAAEFSETIQEQFPIEEYPYLGEIITQYMMKANYDARGEFEFGLNLIIDGIAGIESKK
jgi:hypothetical protein